jgi:DNA-binding CsgD family transcriptional regulator
VANLNEMVAEREFEKSAVWNDFYRSIGDDTWRALCIGVENQSGIGGVAFHRGRSSKPFGEAAERFLNRHAHALGRVHALRGRISALEKAVVTISHPLDAIANAVFVLTGAGQIVHMNAAARALLDSSDKLCSSSGVLKLFPPPMDRRLKSIIGRTAKTRDNEGSAFCINDGRNGRINLTIVPTAPFRGQPQVMVIADSTPTKDPTVESRLRTLYGLSAGEARLATMLADGLEPAEIAQFRGVALGTVRQQIKSIAAKMECRRQADIVRLVLTLPALAGTRT